MKRIRKYLLVFLITATNRLSAQRLYLNGIIKDDQGKFLLGSCDFSLYLDGRKDSIPFTNLWTGKSFLLNNAILPFKATSIKVIINKPGFERTSRLFAPVTWKNDRLELNLGEDVILKRIDSKIDINITGGYTQKNPPLFFKIQFLNRSNEVIIIKKTTIEFTAPFNNNTNCFGLTPDVSTFTISDKIFFSHRDSVLKFNGSYQEDNLLQYAISGEAGYNQCSHNQYLRISMATGITLKPKAVTEARFLLNNRFRILSTIKPGAEALKPITKYEFIHFEFIKQGPYGMDIPISADVRTENVFPIGPANQR